MTTHCKAGHPRSPDNVYTRVRGNRVVRQCRTCKRLRRRANQRARQQAGITCHNMTKAAVLRAVTRDHVERIFETVRETGRIDACFDIVKRSQLEAFFHFNRKIHQQVRKLKYEIVRSQSVIRAPAIALRDPAVAARVMEQINNAVPRYLSRDHRDDVISDMVNAWYTRRLRAADIEKRTKEFVNARFKSDHNKWGDISLDVPLSIDGTVTLGDILPEDRRLWSPCP